MAKPINQQLIADRLQISRTTVSRCFTNHPGINPKTRGKVFKLAAALGYNHLETRSADIRARKNSERFSVLICTDVKDYLSTDFESPGEKLLAGASDYAQVNNVSLDVHFVDPADTSLSDPSYAKIKAFAQASQGWDAVGLSVSRNGG